MNVGNRRYRLIVCAILLAVIPSAKSYSQWNEVGRFTHEMHCGFFFNEMVGFIGGDEETRNVNGTSAFSPIFRTTNGGVTWIETNCEPVPRTNALIPPVVTDIFFRDSLNGWASVEAGARRLLRTTDGGRNWNVVNIAGRGTSVYQTPSALIVSTRDPASSGVVSFDNGSVFTNAFADSTNCVDFVDNLHGVATGYEGSPAMRTTDGGQTWIWITPVFTEESWGVYAVKGTSTFYIIPEGDPSGFPVRSGASPIYRSNDYGASWQQIGTAPIRGTGHPEGFGSQILYIQTEQPYNDNGTNNGIYRSDNGGLSWKAVGGPSHNRDRRFVVTGCRGGVVYAFDKGGYVYKTRTGGDGTIIEPDPVPLFSGLPIVFSSRICEKQNASIKIRNEYCEDLVIRDVAFINTTGPLVTSGALAITGGTVLPKLIGESTTDSVTFTWDPGKLFDRDTMVSVQVRISYFNKAIGVVYDTVITINARAVGDMPSALLTPPALGFGNVSFCKPHDTLFTFTNTGCDTLAILSANGGAPVRYQITDPLGNQITYPLYIPPGSSFTYRLSLYLDEAGSYQSTLRFRLSHQGKERDTTLSLSAIVSPAGSFQAPLIIDMGQVSVCSDNDTVLDLRNLGCDTMRLSTAFLQFSKDFSLLVFSVPENILPDSSSRLKVILQPKSLGFVSDTLTLTFTTLDTAITIKIVLRGEGTSGTAYFVRTPPTDTLFSLALNRCDSARTYPVTISNPGCAKLNLSEITLTGAPAANVSSSLSSALPVDISNNQHVTALITVRPKIIGTYNGTIRIRYQIEGESERDTTMYFALSVSYGRRVLSVAPTNIDLGTFRLCTTIDTSITIRNNGCDTLSLTGTTISTNINSLTPLYSPRTLLPPGDTTSMRVRFEPLGAGTLNANISLSSTTDSVNPLLTNITATIIPTDTVRLRLAPLRVPFYVGDTITIGLYAESDVPISFGLRNITFLLNFNGDLLTVISPTSLIPGMAIIPGLSRRTLPSKLESQTYVFYGAPFITFRANQPIAEFTFAVSLTDTTTTPLYLSDIVLNSNEPDYAKCTLGIITSQTSAELTLLCGDSTLREFLRSGSVIGLRIAPTFPNPITWQSHFQATLPFSSAIEQRVRLTIIDQRGSVVKTMTSTASKGENSLTLDASGLASGAYHFAISPFDGTSEAVVGRFIIQR